MNPQKIAGFLRQNLIFYIIGFFLLLGMKFYYSQADAGSLRWILGPTAGWVEILSGIPFVYERGMGYVNHSLRFLIAPSCSGVQFMIITTAMLVFSFSHRVGCRPPESFVSSDVIGASGTAAYTGSEGKTTIKKALHAGRHCTQAIRRTMPGLGWIALSLLLSYLLTIFINGLRIIAAIHLPSFFERIHAFDGFLTADRLHAMIGAVVYFAALLTIYRLVSLLFDRFQDAEKDRPSASILRRCLSPVFWYFFIVLGVPFLNRAYSKNSGQFTEFALSVSLCCGCVLILYGFGALLRRKLWSRE